VDDSWVLASSEISDAVVLPRWIMVNKSSSTAVSAASALHPPHKRSWAIGIGEETFFALGIGVTSILVSNKIGVVP